MHKERHGIGEISVHLEQSTINHHDLNVTLSTPGWRMDYAVTAEFRGFEVEPANEVDEQEHFLEDDGNADGEEEEEEEDQ